MEGLGLPTTEADFEIFEEDGKLRGRLPCKIHPDDDIAWALVGRGGPGA